jgi:CheY-like chemotaxis protein/HPt (histidine-containing phosphotransfer) domain-containing protein
MHPIDPVLRDLFEEEATEELDGIEAMLPRATDPEAAQALYRHAHTLKGSAAVVGLAEVNRIAATLEELFGDVREGALEPTASFQAAILAAVADLRYIVSGLLGGLDVSAMAADVERALGQLGASGAPAEPEAEAPTGPSAAAGAAPAPELLQAMAAAQLATLRITARHAGLDPAALPEYRALDALLSPQPAARGTVLVVEDSPTQRERHRAILAGGGFTVRTAADGAEALSLLEHEPADAVVTDLEMPTMDGWELTHAIRTHPELAGIGVVVVSSRADGDARRRSSGAGADAYLVKTVDPDELLGLVERVAGA